MTDKLEIQAWAAQLRNGPFASPFTSRVADALEAQQARIEELEAEARRWEAGAEAEAKAGWAARDKLTRAEARIRALEEALEPFAGIAQYIADRHDDTRVNVGAGLIRRAKQVLEGKE